MNVDESLQKMANFKYLGSFTTTEESIQGLTQSGQNRGSSLDFYAMPRIHDG